MYVRARVCVNVCACACVLLYMCVYSICMCVCVYVCIYYICMCNYYYVRICAQIYRITISRFTLINIIVDVLN